MSYTLTPAIEAAETIDSTSSYSVSFIQRALLEWSGVADGRERVTVDHCKVILIALTKAINMMPPLERPKLVAYLLRIYGNAKISKACASFINLLAGLISAEKNNDVDSLWESLDADPTVVDVATICSYLSRKTFWFKLGDLKRVAVKSALYSLKSSLGLVGAKSGGKKGTAKSLFDVKISPETRQENARVEKRKRGKGTDESPASTGYGLVLMHRFYNSITSDSGSDTIPLIIELTDATSSDSTIFRIKVSPAQASEYLSLRKIEIKPVESAGLKLVDDLVDFILLPLDQSECAKRLKAAQTENIDLDIDDLLSSNVVDLGSRFRTCAVSLDASPFPSSSNIAIDEVSKAVSCIEQLQKQKFGLVSKLAPTLGSDNILPIFNQFDGEIKSYLSNRRKIDCLLFENYPGLFGNPLVNPSLLSTLAIIDKKICYVPPRNVYLSCGNAAGAVGRKFPLASTDGKTDLSKHSITKQNGTRFLDVRNVSLSLNGKEVLVVGKTNYNVVNESSVAPLVNAETPRYAAGDVVLRDTGDEFEISIPVRIHLDFTTPKSDKGYFSLLTSSRYSETFTVLAHRPILDPPLPHVHDETCNCSEGEIAYSYDRSTNGD